MTYWCVSRSRLPDSCLGFEFLLLRAPNDRRVEYLDSDGAVQDDEPQVQRVARKQYNNEQTPQLLASPELLRQGAGRLLERASR